MAPLPPSPLLPQNQGCSLDPQVFLLLQTTLIWGWGGGLMAFKQNEILDE